MSQPQTVFVVDDEPAITRAISRLLTAEGYTTRAFDSAQEFMDNYVPGTAGCVLVDVSMPGITGLDLQRWLMRLGHQLPVVFLTAFDDICDTDQTMMDRAVDVLSKPIGPLALLRAVEQALARDRKARLGQPPADGQGSAHSIPPA